MSDVTGMFSTPGQRAHLRELDHAEVTRNEAPAATLRMGRISIIGPPMKIQVVGNQDVIPTSVIPTGLVGGNIVLLIMGSDGLVCVLSKLG